ncbi:MAG TPA: ORF6N domain-containing protein [Methanocorpusculum sp.]|nr:ORF6N domain-containing protein [Methanocorpusculum sp.]
MNENKDTLRTSSNTKDIGPILEKIQKSVYILRGQQVMLDTDLADIYGYDVKALNQQVKRNISRFPEDFMFQLRQDEIDSVKSQFVTSPDSHFFSGQSGGRRKPPYAFTEQGIYMLATVLRGELAEQQSTIRQAGLQFFPSIGTSGRQPAKR